VCNCGEPIRPGSAIALAGDIYCPRCAPEMARDLLGRVDLDPKIRAQAIEALRIEAARAAQPKPPEPFVMAPAVGRN
jgi:hypothetical protein